MNNNAWFKKENPFQTVIGFGGGATGFGAHSSSASKTYIDDVFSTYLWKGTGSSKTISNSIDLAGEGGLTWIKNRSWAGGTDHMLYDTVRGATKFLSSNDDGDEGTETGGITSFNSSGFTVGGNGESNQTNASMSSWTFRKASEFFTICTWTGNDTNQSISHDLGCVPGMIICKSTTSTRPWMVYHRGTDATAPEDKYLRLNETNAVADAATWNDFKPTSTTFQVGASNGSNENGQTYIAYLFGGGGSADAKNISLGAEDSTNGANTNDGYMRIPSHSDLTLDGDFTLEIFVKKRGSVYDYMFTIGDSQTATGFQLYFSGSTLKFYGGIGSATNFDIHTIDDYDWHHICATRSGTTLKIYVDGILRNTQFENCTATYSGDITTGENYSTGADGTGTPSRSATDISNFRITKGQVLYTGDRFTVPHNPLTTTSQGATASNVKLLCFQSSTITEATVSPTTIVHENTNGNVTATASAGPFDGGAVFGESGEEQALKCGSYEGNNADDGTEVFLGWEPSFLLIKSVDTADNWCIFDNLRGMTVDGINDQALFPNATDAEAAGGYLTPTSTGFKLTTQSDRVNNNSTYIYTAIRRPDGYVGKPPELGTDVFSLATGNGSSTIPSLVAGFPIDMSIIRKPAETFSWYMYGRLRQGKYLVTDQTAAEAADGNGQFDSMTGFYASTAVDSDWQGWSWKRHAGFDVVTYKGNGNNTDGANAINHSLGKTPEMIWIKTRSGPSYSGVTHWTASHKGLNGGTNPWQYTVSLNNTWAETTTSNFGNTAPTSTHFYVGDPGNGRSNSNGDSYLAMLFASVDGISKVGSFSGVASASYPLSVTTGFAPRFILIKAASGVSGYGWFVWDSLRSSGNDNLKLALNSTAAQDSGTTYQYFNNAPISANSNGFSIVDDGWGSTSGIEFIYYAHA